MSTPSTAMSPNLNCVFIRAVVAKAFSEVEPLFSPGFPEQIAPWQEYRRHWDVQHDAILPHTRGLTQNKKALASEFQKVGNTLGKFNLIAPKSTTDEPPPSAGDPYRTDESPTGEEDPAADESPTGQKDPAADESPTSGEDPTTDKFRAIPEMLWLRSEYLAHKESGPRSSFGKAATEMKHDIGCNRVAVNRVAVNRALTTFVVAFFERVGVAERPREWVTDGESDAYALITAQDSLPEGLEGWPLDVCLSARQLASIAIILAAPEDYAALFGKQQREYRCNRRGFSPAHYFPEVCDGVAQKIRLARRRLRKQVAGGLNKKMPSQLSIDHISVSQPDVRIPQKLVFPRPPMSPHVSAQMVFQMLQRPAR